jgi:hypothetical protein
MVAELKSKTIHVTPELRLAQVLEEAMRSPVLLEQDGVLFRLTREPDVIASVLLDRREPPAPRGENEPLVDYFERISNFVMHGRVFTDDSTDLLRESRIERTAEFLGATGSLTRDDPIWWDLARSTVEHFTRVREAIFGDRVAQMPEFNAFGR